MQSENADINWIRSPFCRDGHCVEVAGQEAWVAVRDTKHPDTPPLWFTGREWAAFVAGVKSNRFDFSD